MSALALLAPSSEKGAKECAAANSERGDAKPLFVSGGSGGVRPLKCSPRLRPHSVCRLQSPVIYARGLSESDLEKELRDTDELTVRADRVGELGRHCPATVTRIHH